MGTPKSPEHRAKIGAAHRGRKLSEEHRAKLSARRKAMGLHPNFRAAAKLAASTREWSQESRLKLANTKTQGSPSERFWAKVKRLSPEQCWEWQGRRNQGGYGIFGVGSRVDGTRRTVMAHRFALELKHGQVPGFDLKVLHKCDNPPCCNPDHLWIGTQRDNIRDMEAKGRDRRIGSTFVVRYGSDHPRSKTTLEIARQIRERRATTRESQSAIAAAYGISQSTVSKILLGKHFSAR